MSDTYYRVATRFWDDARDLGWDENTQRVGLYVLTCRHRITEGLFRLPPAYAMADLKITDKRLESALARLEADKFIERDGEWVLILKALKFQPPKSESNVKHAVTKLTPMRTPLLARLVELAQELCPPLAQKLVEAKPELRSVPR